MEQSRFACHYCGSGNNESMYPTRSQWRRDYQLRRCGECRAVFLAPRPTAAELAEAYEEVYYGAGGQKFSPKIERLVAFFRGRRSARVAGLLPPGSDVLDIGCGNGEFLQNLLRAGYHCQGLEIPGKAAERAAAIPGLEVKLGPLRENDFPNASFDMVTLWHVFEHLLEPARVMHIIARILKPGGYLALSLPNIESWQGSFFKGRWFHMDPPRHLFFLGPQALRTELRKFGFRQIKSSFMSLEQNPFGIQQSLLNMCFRDRDVLYEALKGVPGITSTHSRLSLGLQKLFFLAGFPLFTALALVEAACRKGGTMEFIYKLEGDHGVSR